VFDVRIASIYFPPTPIPSTATTSYPYALLRDGQRFLVVVDTSQQTTEPPMTVVGNWTAAIKK